jgi:hypothetical protein
VGTAARAAALREPALRGLHLLVLSAFALAQPLLDILGKNAEFFAVRGSTALDVVAFALAITFVPALVLLALELAVGALHVGAGRLLHLVFAGALAGLFAVQAFERAGLDATVLLIAAAAAIALAAAVALWRMRAFRSFLTVLGPAPLVFLGLFLFTSPASDIVFAEDVDVDVASVRADAPVVMVVFDELPTISLLGSDGEIDEGRFPNFARLARDSTWFRNTTTLSGSTTLAVPALLTGNAPRRGSLPLFQEHPRNLFTLLAGRYRLNVTESQTRLCPAELCEREAPETRERLASLYSDARVVYLHLVAPPALEDRLPAIDEAWGNFGQEEVAEEEIPLDAHTDLPGVDIRTFYVGRVREWKRFVRSIGSGGSRRPSLDFLHVLLPHGPWLYFPDGRVSGVAEPRAPGRKGELWWDEGLALQAHQRHLLQLGYTDKLLGELLAKLERTGRYERSLVVVTADHGISFRAGDLRRAPTEANLPELAFVPLFLKLPGESRGRIVDDHVRITDIVPTIAAALGTELPWKISGRSALDEAFEPSNTVRVGRVRAPFEETLAAREASLRRQLGLFGEGDWDLYGAEDPAQLVGTPVADLAGGGVAGAATVDSTGSRLLRSLRPRARVVPTPLAGTLEGVEKGEQLILAVNGRVAGVARAYQRDGEDSVRFSVLADPDAFRPGRNDVRFFAASVEPGVRVAPRKLETRLSE